MIFTKIKRTKTGMYLAYMGTEIEGGGNYTMESDEEPTPRFITALQDLIPNVLSMCELPNTNIEMYIIKGIILSYGDEGEQGITITALKQLISSSAPLVLNTPHSKSAEHEGLLKKIETLEIEAVKYMQGNRLQLDLFRNQKEAMPV